MELKLVWGADVIVNLRIVYTRIIATCRQSEWLKNPLVDPGMFAYYPSL